MTVTRYARRIDMLNELTRANSVGMEVGVFAGAFSRQLIDVVKPRVLHCVDTWGEAVIRQLRTNADGGVEHFERPAYEASADFYRTMMPELLTGRVIPHRFRSLTCLPWFPDSRLDWIYLDGAHDYETVAGELVQAARIVRPGGWITGHDYCELMPGVIRAVDEFAASRGLKVLLTNEAATPIKQPHPVKTCAFNSFAMQCPDRSVNL